MVSVNEQTPECVAVVCKLYPGFTRTYIDQEEDVQKEILQVMFTRASSLSLGMIEDTNLLQILKEHLVKSGRMEFIRKAMRLGFKAAEEKWPGLISLYPKNLTIQSSLDEIVRVVKHAMVDAIIESEYSGALDIITETEMDILVVEMLEAKFPVTVVEQAQKHISDSFQRVVQMFPDLVTEYPLANEPRRQDITGYFIRQVMATLQDVYDSGLVNTMVRSHLEAFKKSE